MLTRGIVAGALIASGMTAVVATAGPVSAAPAFTVDRDSVVTVHSSAGIAGSANPRVVAADGAVSTLTLANSAWVLRGGALAPDGTLYLQDASVVPTRVVKIAPDGTESVVADLDFPAAGQFAPTTGDVTILPDGDLVVSAYRAPNTRFTRVDPATGTATTLFTLTNGEAAPRSGTDAAGNLYYFTTLTSQKQVWKVSPTVGATPTLVGGTGTFGYDMTVDSVGNVYVAGGVGVSSANHGEITKFTLQGNGSYSASALWGSTPTVAQGGYSADGGIAATLNGQIVLARSDGAGNATLYRYSSAGGTPAAAQAVTGVYPQVLTALPASNVFTDGVDASISGTVRVGEALTGSGGTYVPSDATLGYVWKVSSNVVSTTSSYTPKLADAGRSLTLTVTGTKSGYSDSVSTSAGQTVATVQGFTGTLKAGETLTASDTSGTNTWGISASSSCSSQTITTGSSSTFVLPADSAGKYVQLSQILGDRGGSGTCTGPIAAATSPATITGAATASGVKGESFSYTPTIGGKPAPSVTVQGALPTGVSVDSSTGALTGTPSVAGTFPVTLRADNGVGSAATQAVTITIADVVTGLSPTISGMPKVGVQLTASAGSSLAPDAAAGASVAYRWELYTEATGWSDLEAGPTYTPGAQQVGGLLRAKVVVTKSGYQTATAYSAATAAVAKGTFAIGAPSISGTAKVGETLTCEAAGGTPGTLSYAWTRGATPLEFGSTHQLTAADLAQQVTCTVTAARAGYESATNSADSATVGKGAFTISAPSISGTAAVGETLTCGAADGTPGTLSYAWSRGATPLDTGASYELIAADRTEQVTCTVTAERVGYDDATASKDSATVGSGTFTISAPSITGTAKVGQTLTCEAASGTPGTVSYAWTRGATDLGSGDSYVLVAADRTEQVTCTVTAERAGYDDASASKDSATVGSGTFTIDAPSITGTAAVGEMLTCAAAEGTPGSLSYAWTRGETPLDTGASYELVAADRTEQVTCTVTAERVGYDDASASKDSATVGSGTFTIGAPSISGTAKVGETLTCAAADGTPGTISYAWTRGATPLDTGASYELVAADRTEQVTCTVTAERVGYDDATASKDSATVGSGTFTIGAPSITGTAKVGETLTCEAADGTPGTISYAWTRGATPLDTGASYELVADDRGEQVTCGATSMRAGYTDATNSADSATVGYGTFVIDAPSISGTAKVGETLTCEAADGTPGDISYAWSRGADRLGTGAGHVLSADDRGEQLTCTVTAQRPGYTDAVNEADSEPIDYGVFAIGAPSITGTAQVGQTLTCVPAAETPGTLSFGWTRGSAEVGSGTRYELKAADRAQQVTCTVTAVRAGYVDASNQVTSATVAAAPVKVTGLKPRVVGRAVEGSKVTAEAGNVVPSTAVRSYQWLADGKKIKGATSRTLKLGKSQAGRKISVRVTAKAGAVQATATSPARMVASSAKRLVIVRTSARGEKLTVTATGLTPGRKYAIWLGGQKRATGVVGKGGTVSRAVTFGSKIKPGTRRVRVSTYKKSGKRATTVYRTVNYR